MFEVSLFGSPEDENCSGDSGEKMRTDAQLLRTSITGIISQGLVVLGTDQLGQVNILNKFKSVVTNRLLGVLRNDATKFRTVFSLHVRLIFSITA